MTSKLFKKILFALTFCAFLFSLTLISVKANKLTGINYLNISVGETYDTVGVSYHCSEDSSYVIYGTQLSGSTITDAKRVEVTSTKWKFDAASAADESSGYGFEERYVCKANLTNLQEYTTYYVQAVSNSYKSPVKSFKTTGDDGRKTSFLFLTDIQSSGTGFKNSENLMKAIYSKAGANQPNLLFMTGDQVDRGGIEQQWIDYYQYCPSASNILQATLPGNHEYYTTSGGGYITNEVYNQFYNNPLNGPEDKLGSSYYFVYDHILFIMLDIVKYGYNVTAQQQWFKEVVKNNPSQWIIVGSHPGMYATGAYASDSENVRRNWIKIFEECQVDIAFNGHEHVYARKNLRYGGTTSSTAGNVNADLGVTYLAGGAAGLKNYGGQAQTTLTQDFDFFTKQSSNTGCLVTVDDETLKVELYNAGGTILDTFTLEAKRPHTIEPVEKDEVLDLFEVNYDEETKKAIVSWSDSLYGTVEKVNVSQKDGNSYVVNMASGKLNKKEFSIANTEINYSYHVTVTLKDGTVLEKDLPLILNEDAIEYTITYNLDGGVNNPNNPTVYTKGMLPLTLLEPTKEGYVFKRWELNGRKISEITELRIGDLELVAVWEKAPDVAPQPTPTPTPAKKGCKKNAVAGAIGLTLIIGLGCIVLRKKH